MSVVERAALDRERAVWLDRLASDLASVERYRIIRKYVQGVVVDAACGSGFGSWILSRCPSVRRVIGLDRDPQTLARATQNFPECAFAPVDLDEGEDFGRCLLRLQPEVVVSVETIEHLRDGSVFLEAVRRSGARRLVLTFPSFPTRGFNVYHLRDWTVGEVTAVLEREPTVAFVIGDTSQLAVYDLR